MRGEPIEAVKVGISTLLSSLCQDPYALETVCLSIITYNSKAEQILPLTEVYKLQVPELVAKGRSAMGEALLLLSERIDNEVVKTTPEQKGDWKPLLFLLSDGGYSGPIAKPIEEFKKRKFAVVVACAAGDKSHIDVLRRITNNVIKISTTETQNILAYFKWISSSISTTSTKIENSGNDEVVIQELPPLPQEIQILHSFD
jgi:uncharacterized protein YegL